MTDTSPLVDIRILELPMDIFKEASEHNDELMREFALIEERDPSETRQVPRRLLALMAELRDRFSAFTGEQERELEDALDRGEKSVDVVYRVPAAVKTGVIELGALLDEADDFCRQGEQLLTLATPPRALAFRRWLFEEFVRQADGEPPRPWPEYERLVGKVERANRA